MPEITDTPKQHLLLVDDSRVARLVLKHLIHEAQLPYEVHEAASADEALLRFSEYPCDIALIDYNMPGKNGIELAQDLKAINPHLRMLLITANIQQAIVQRASEMGMRFLGKPITAEQLTEALRGD